MHARLIGGVVGRVAFICIACSVSHGQAGTYGGEYGMAGDLIPDDRSSAHALSHMACSFQVIPCMAIMVAGPQKTEKAGHAWLIYPSVQGYGI